VFPKEACIILIATDVSMTTRKIVVWRRSVNLTVTARIRSARRYEGRRIAIVNLSHQCQTELRRMRFQRLTFYVILAVLGITAAAGALGVLTAAGTAYGESLVRLSLRASPWP